MQRLAVAFTAAQLAQALHFAACARRWPYGAPQLLWASLDSLSAGPHCSCGLPPASCKLQDELP
jgi:hypothetical protein